MFNLNYKMILFLAFAIVLIVPSGQAKEDKSLGLYVNLATIENVKAGHAFAQSKKLQERGHPITFFLNGKAILIAVKGVPQTSFQGVSLQVWLTKLIADGAKVIVCKVCMELHGITDADLVDGAVIGSPDVVSNYLFDPSYKVISW